MSAQQPEVRRVILGTAGHIDHGKTTLVERLTGTWTARLPEEQERGMTIDVGYAAFLLPDGTEVGLLDVPGHESFVHTMVAGATAMDLALLVVAADDGPMLQTREHVEILDLLGVERLVVALTKVDLVDDDTASLAEEEIRNLLAGTGMHAAPIVRVSSIVGTGLDELRRRLFETIDHTPRKRDDDRVFRMPLLRGFVVEGRGTVVTGVPTSGCVAVGDKIEILPPGHLGRVRGIQVHGRPAERAHVGQRTALALSDMDASKVVRGMVVAGAGVLKPAQRLLADVRCLATLKKPLAHGERVRMHVGAAKVVAQVHLPSGKAIPPGGRGFVELVPSVPVVALPGDRCILRTENASATLGGGKVVDLLERPLPRRREGLLERVAARLDRLDEAEVLVEGALEAAGDQGLLLEALAARTGLLPQSLPATLAGLAKRGVAVALGRAGLWMDGNAFARVVERTEEALRRLHAKDPGIAALPLSLLRSSAGRFDAAVFDGALARLEKDGKLDRMPDGGVRHAGHGDALPAADRVLCDGIVAALARGGGQPPDVNELSATLAVPVPEVQRGLRLLASRHRVFRAADFWFEVGWLEGAKARLATLAAERGGFTPSDARSVLDSTRKWVVPLLEALDKVGFTRRQGDKRVLRAAPSGR